jgi:predicted metal-dependent hydrolase
MSEQVGPSRIEIRYGQTQIPISIRRSRRTTFAIEVHPDCSVGIVAPEEAGLDAILKIAARKSAWIQRARREFDNYLPRPSEKRFVRGESFRYLGKQYRLKLTLADRPEASLRPPFLDVKLPQIAPDAARTIVGRWYRDRAATRLPIYFAQCVQQASSFFALAPPLRIRTMPKRWGSCLDSGTIVLNPELIKVRSDCIRYVAFHELAHLRHPNHGRRFTQLLEALCPEWRVLKEKLEKAEL